MTGEAQLEGHRDLIQRAAIVEIDMGGVIFIPC